MLVGILKRLGADEVHEAANGTDALDIIERLDQAVDIIVSDLDMPEMDGMELMRHLGDSNTPSSLIIASSMDQPLVRAVVKMATAYRINLLGSVDKPPSPDILLQLIESHDARKNQHRSSRGPSLQFRLEEIEAGLDNGQFEPFFQPKVSLDSGRVLGLEALARWRHPEHGVLPPFVFIEEIEDGGLIDKLTRAMIERATAWCKTWRDQDLDVAVAINISIHTLTQVGLAERLTRYVIEQGLEPRHVTLEVTETVAMTDLGRVLENLSRLRMKGFMIAIDDYGTGYSSMQQLDRTAATELKIDRSFVTGAGKQKSSRVILQSSLEMADRLGLTSVAEGVETLADWNLLSEFGCDQAQGYFIARPMAAEEVAEWIKNWHTDGRHELPVQAG